MYCYGKDKLTRKLTWLNWTDIWSCLRIFKKKSMKYELLNIRQTFRLKIVKIKQGFSQISTNFVFV